MGEKKHILYVQTSGVDTPKRLYSPFVLGMTAKAMDIDATIYFLGLGVTVVKKGEAEKIKEGSFPTVKEIMDQAAAAGVSFLVFEQSTQLQQQMAHIEAQTRRTTRAVLAGSTLISATLLYVHGEIVLAVGVAVLSGLWLVSIFTGNDVQ